MHFVPSSTRLKHFVREPVRKKRSKSFAIPGRTARCWTIFVALFFGLLLMLEWSLWSFSGQRFRVNLTTRKRPNLWNKGKDDPVVRSSQRPTKEPQYRQWERCHPVRTEQEDPQIYEWCHDASNTFRFYNPLSFPRYICHNVRIAADGIMNGTARDCPPWSARLFRSAPEGGQPPVVDATATDPMAVHFHEHATPRELFPDCDVPCLHDGGPMGNNCVRTVDAVAGPHWKFIFSMEGPQYYGNLYVNPEQWRENQFWSTTSYQSEIPLPYYSQAEYHIWHQDHVSFDKGIKAAVFLARNCASMNHREQIVKDLSASSFRVDALSSCLHNADPPPQVDRNLGNKIQVMKQYLFYLAFENQCVDDYITEKLWGPYEAGTIPVYFGAPNVKDHVPNHSLILVDDFQTTQELAEHLEQVANDRDLYESYHAWRTEPPPPHFRARYDMTATHSTCRTCRWAYARTHGLGWNHTSQSLRPLLGDVGSRAVCVSKEQLMQHPLVESWTNARGQAVAVAPVASSGSTCPMPLQDGSRMIEIDDGAWRRTVYHRDGWVDFVIETKTGAVPKQYQESPLRLQLKTLLKAPIAVRKIRDGVWHWQSNISRYTVLVAPSKDTDAVVVKQGSETSLVDIVVSAPMRLRILVEDVDTFHRGADQVESYFGKLAADDFFTPVEVSVLVPEDRE
jgi:Glycosyltransferase family 10 (fucosyltransferase) C-term